MEERRPSSLVNLERMMKNSLIVGVATVALLGLPNVALAQTKNKQGPGQSEYAPGQKAQKPGSAKKYAPGQRMHRYDNPKYPGASEYAPGHQPRK
jgi:hypothetical protein